MQYTNGNPAKLARNTSIADGRLAGMSLEELAKEHDLSPSHVCRILKDDEIKEMLEAGTRHLVSMVPQALVNYRAFLTDTEHPNHYKASKDCLQTTGILASHTQSQTIVNILNVQSGPGTKQIQRIAELIEARHAADLGQSNDIIDIPADDIRNQEPDK